MQKPVELPPPTKGTIGPKKIEQLEKKKSNLERRIQRNPNDKKAINKLEGLLKQIGFSPEPKPKAGK